MFSPNGSGMPEKKEIWIALVKDDLGSASALLKEGHGRNAVILSASAVEKMLKFYLCWKGLLSEADSTHNTAHLAQRCGFQDIPVRVKDIFYELKNVHVPASYPESEWAFRAVSDPGYAQAIYNDSLEAVKWILGRVAADGGDSDE